MRLRFWEKNEAILPIPVRVSGCLQVHTERIVPDEIRLKVELPELRVGDVRLVLPEVLAGKICPYLRGPCAGTDCEFYDDTERAAETTGVPAQTISDWERASISDFGITCPTVRYKVVGTTATVLVTVPSGKTCYLQSLICSGDGTNQETLEVGEGGVTAAVLKISAEIPSNDTRAISCHGLPITANLMGKASGNTIKVCAVGIVL